MTRAELIAYLEALPEPTREGSDAVLEHLGWERHRTPYTYKDGFHGVRINWTTPEGRGASLERPHVLADLQACVDHVVPEGFEWELEVTDVAMASMGDPLLRLDWERPKDQPAFALCIASLKAMDA